MVIDVEQETKRAKEKMNNSVSMIMTIIMAAVLLNIIFKRKRTAELQEKVKTLGYSFIPKGVLPKGLRELRFSGLKSGMIFASARNIIHKQFDSYEISIFEYGRRRNQAYFAVNYFHGTLPDFNLYPNSVGKKIDMSMSKLKRIQMENDPQFNEKFLIYGHIDTDYHQLFKGEIREWVMATDNFSFEARKDSLMFYRDGGSLDINNIDKAIPLAKEVGDLFLNQILHS